MIEPIKYEIPLFMPNKSKLKEYDEELYEINELIERYKYEIEEEMMNIIKKRWWKSRINNWRKWYWLLYRFKVLLIKNMYDYTYRDMENMIKRDIAIKMFIGIEDIEEETPTYAIINLWQNEFWEDFIKEMNKKIVIMEWKRKHIIKWRRSRTDTTVIEENVAYPTDSTLIKKWKEKIIRSVNKITNIVWEKAEKMNKGARKNMRKMKKAYYDIKKYVRRRTEEAKKEVVNKYEEMIEYGEKTIKRVREGIKDMKRRIKRESNVVKEKVKREVEKLEDVLTKYGKVIKQANKRMIKWEEVKAEEKIISYESDSASIIRRWKEWKKMEIWQKLSITEVEWWIVSNWEMYDKNPSDVTLIEESIRWCEYMIWKKPKKNVFDRWYWDKERIKKIEKEDNIRLYIPKRWKKNKEEEKWERSRDFVVQKKYRAWSEWKISVLKRRWIWKLRVRWKESTRNIVWWIIFTNNLRYIT